MADLSRDPIINAVYNGIKEGIRTCLSANCWGSTAILIYSGIDAMAYVAMPSGQVDVGRKDFVSWVDRYVHFPCKEQITGLDLYGARCGMVHNHSTFSRLTREGKCRTVGYVDQSRPAVIYRPEVSTSLVMVSIRDLAEAFFSGVDRFLVDVFSQPDRAAIAEERFQKLVHTLPFRAGEDET